MKVLEIHDMKPSGNFLAVDLRHILDVLGDAASQSFWRVCKPEVWNDDFFVEATGEGAKDLEQLAETGVRIPGLELLEIAHRTHQVIWGLFAGYEMPAAGKPWIFIYAVDSSRYEVHTDSEVALGIIQECFNDVRLGEPHEIKFDRMFS